MILSFRQKVDLICSTLTLKEVNYDIMGVVNNLHRVGGNCACVWIFFGTVSKSICICRIETSE